MKLMVSFCCNDERGYTGPKVTAIHLPDGLLDIETIHEDGLGFKEVRPNQVKVSRRVFKVHGYRPWYGNLFWNGYVMEGRDVFRLLVWAKESGKWHCDGGWEEACNWWDRPTGFDEWTLFSGLLKEARNGA